MIWIASPVLDFIYENGSVFSPKETGGVLMGYQVSKNEFVINHIIGPGPKAQHGFASFTPDQMFHQEEISDHYIKSGCLETYLGDWHTHPNSTPYLSAKDKETVRRIANHIPARISSPIMLVAAPPNTNFKVWIYEKIAFRRATYQKSEFIIY
jgi:integrative and conjugative element protein (TIGR02256 family)